jgi:uncharacterized protein (DUF2236 family)
VLPTDDELASLVPGPQSVTWQRAADVRTLLAAGYALVMQVAHPTVGAGVAEHSSYRTDPWGRLMRTLDLTTCIVYADPGDAAAVAREVRARHRRIRGTTADGGRYHALEPSAYAWVWASLFDSIVAAHGRFGVPLARIERERFWQEWRLLGRLLGVRERDLPDGLDAYEHYFEDMVQNVLQDNDSVRGVLAAIADPGRPPLPAYARPAWSVSRLPAARTLRLATIGMLHPTLRERLQLRLSRAEELELRALGIASRAATPVLPRQLRMFGPTYMRMRRSDSRLAAA